MARKKKHPEHVNHERWLISYADFITLLFAFFVVMFATSQTDSNKVGRFTESFSKAVGIEVFAQSGTTVVGGGTSTTPTTEGDKQDMLPAELEELRATLAESAKEDPNASGVRVLPRKNELVLRLADTLIFDSGNDNMTPQARKVLHVIATQLKAHHVDIRVEGHTDERPISTPRFPSNWELSTARAMAVIRVLASAESIEADRLSAAGYAQFHPIATNATVDGRAQNRRVDLVITPSLPAAALTVADASDAGPATDKAEGTKAEGTKAEGAKAEGTKAEAPSTKEGATAKAEVHE